MTALGRSSSLSLPRRLPSMSSRSDYGSPVTTPVFQPSWGPLERRASWLETGPKPPSPWEAASRSPLGLVDEAFARRSVQEAVASGVRSAAQRRSLPEPPAEWKARVGHEAHPDGAPPFSSPTRSTPAQYGPPFSSPTRGSPALYGPPFSSPTRGSPALYGPSFTSPTRGSPAQYGPPFRQYQPQRSVMGAGAGYTAPSYDYRRPLSQPGYGSMYNAAWRR